MLFSSISCILNFSQNNSALILKVYRIYTYFLEVLSACHSLTHDRVIFLQNAPVYAMKVQGTFSKILSKTGNTGMMLIGNLMVGLTFIPLPSIASSCLKQ